MSNLMKYTPACIISHFSMNMLEFNFMYRTTFALHLNDVRSQTRHKANLKHAFIAAKKKEKIVLIVLNCWQMKRSLNTLK